MTPSKQLFGEALSYYLHTLSQRHMLLQEDRETLLIAIHGLTQLGNYPLARALIRLTFSYLTADEYLSILEDARRTQRSKDLDELPF